MLQDWDSFDYYTDMTQRWSAVKTGTNPVYPVISALAARTGIYGLRFASWARNTSGLGSTDYILRSISGTPGTIIHGNALILRTYPTNAVDYGRYITFLDAGSEQCSIHINAQGQFVAKRGATVLGTSANSLALNTYKYVEIKAVIHNSAGSIIIHVNGETWLTVSGANTRGGTANNYTTAFAYWITVDPYIATGITDGTVVGFDIDDYILLDTTGTYNKDFIGDVAIKAKVANANGSLNQWTRNTGANNFETVVEIPADEDTSYVADAAVGDIDRYLFPATVGTIVKAVGTKLRARKDDGTARSIRAAVKSGATTSDNGADLALGTSYDYYNGLFETDPNTGLSWAIAAVNAAEFGVKVTL